MMNPFVYDFGYGWAWNYGHLAAVAPFAILAWLAWKVKWPRWVLGISIGLAARGVVGLVIVQMVLRLNLPLELPTERFLEQGAGQVLDAGAGSGRASLMALLERPGSGVVALDLYDGYYGIADNTPKRLFANAARAGVEERIQARVGDMRDMPFEDASFDAAVSAYAIDHLSREGVERSLAEIERVLRPDGQFLLMVINPDIWIRVAYPFFVHHGYFGGRTDHERWRSRLTRAGFEVEEQGTTPATLYLLARKPRKHAGPDAASGSEDPAHSLRGPFPIREELQRLVAKRDVELRVLGRKPFPNRPPRSFPRHRTFSRPRGLPAPNALPCP